MLLQLSKRYKLIVIDHLDWNSSTSAWTIDLTVESRSGRLNTQTGMIVPFSELDTAVATILQELNSQPLSNATLFRSIPKIKELLIIRLWELFEDEMPYQVRLTRIDLKSDATTTISYSGLRNTKAKRRKKS